MSATRTVRSSRRFLALAAAILAIGACSSSKSSSSSAQTGGATTTAAAAAASTTTTVDPLAAAQATVAKAEQGTNVDVDPTSRPAVTGKHIVVISQGESNASSQIPSDAAVAAAKAIGWKVDLYDAKLTGNYSPLIRQAIAAGADGIIIDAGDCQVAQQALQEAKAKGIAVVPIYAFDCNDSKGGGGSESLFSSLVSYGTRTPGPDQYGELYGANQADYIIAASHNTAKIIVIHDPEFVVLDWTLQGFKDTIAASGGSQIVDTLNVTASDILSGQLVSKIQAELLRFPSANWIKSPYTYITQLGIVPALGSKAGQINVMGGEGFSTELDFLRAGKITAVNIISSEWEGWAAVDAMNSVFRKEKPVDSGIGFTLADKDHNLPASGNYVPTIDFKSEYKKAWGVS
ncbi:MAG: substrate-binding domain-containing protein [Acidimicrobiales bacterium]